MKKLLVLSALAAFAMACGGSDNKPATDPSSTNTTSETAPATDSSAAPATSAAPAEGTPSN